MEHLQSMVAELEKNKKVFGKAPTGLGKTHITFKCILKLGSKKNIIFTPRLLLNKQMLKKKYTSKYFKKGSFKKLHFSNSNSQGKDLYNISKYDFIITCCYQSANKLLECMKQINLTVDLMIFDEAHFIGSDNWINSELLINGTITKYRMFLSATPTDYIERNAIVYGNIIEKIKVYDLILKEILCNIVTVIKKINNKKTEYHDLRSLIVEAMIKFNKKKGIIYVNNTTNAENLYNLIKGEDKINTYIYVSKNIDTENETDKSITVFENDVKPCIIIVVGKISYEYDNDLIDFICLGDPRQSDIDIRQILGRGLRWNKQNYPNKLLHLLIPLYKNEFGEYSDYGHLKKFLDYIIGECGQDIIVKTNGTNELDNINGGIIGKSYEGDPIPIEILQEYCTTGYNKFTDFMRFLKTNGVYNEIDYNKLREIQNWIPDMGLIQKKYPKFCFRDIHPNKLDYYWTKQEAIIGRSDAYKKLGDIIGADKVRRLNECNKMLKIMEYDIDKRIPFVDFNCYYPKDN